MLRLHLSGVACPERTLSLSKGESKDAGKLHGTSHLGSLYAAVALSAFVLMARNV